VIQAHIVQSSVTNVMLVQRNSGTCILCNAFLCRLSSIWGTSYYKIYWMQPNSWNDTMQRQWRNITIIINRTIMTFSTNRALFTVNFQISHWRQKIVYNCVA